jgi:hypothetical protein
MFQQLFQILFLIHGKSFLFFFPLVSTVCKLRYVILVIKLGGIFPLGFEKESLVDD